MALDGVTVEGVALEDVAVEGVALVVVDADVGAGVEGAWVVAEAEPEPVTLLLVVFEACPETVEDLSLTDEESVVVVGNAAVFVDTVGGVRVTALLVDLTLISSNVMLPVFVLTVLEPKPLVSLVVLGTPETMFALFEDVLVDINESFLVTLFSKVVVAAVGVDDDSDFGESENEFAFGVVVTDPSEAFLVELFMIGAAFVVDVAFSDLVGTNDVDVLSGCGDSLLVLAVLTVGVTAFET